MTSGEKPERHSALPLIKLQFQRFPEAKSRLRARLAGITLFNTKRGESFMTYSVLFDQKPTYLHAIVTGSNTKENVRQYLREVFQECKKRGCSRVLIEERLEGPRLRMMEVYSIVSEGSLRV